MPVKKTQNRSHPVVSAVADTLSNRGMLRHGDKLLVGVSGGPDSVALLHILVELSPDFTLRLGVAHLNHSLRKKASDSDAAFVAALARRLNLACHSVKKDIKGLQQKEGGNLEEKGRQARYLFFEETAAANGYGKIALGHHADDSAELVLMNLLRGSGPGGISGIAPARGPSIVRPLIDIRRRDIMAYLKANRIPFVQDASNQDPAVIRNRIRNELIPELSLHYNPRLPEALVRTAAIIREEEEWLQKLAAGMLDAATIRADSRQVVLSVAYLTGLHRAALRRVIRGAVEKLNGNLKGISFKHINAVSDLFMNRQDRGECHLPGRILAEHRGRVLVMAKLERPLRGIPSAHTPGAAIGFRYEIDRPAGRTSALVIKETGQKLILSTLMPGEAPVITSAGQNCAFFDMKKLVFPLLLRNRQAGDRFTPLGMQGSQKISTFFINNKVPRHKRRNCPVLLSRECIAWVVGHRLGNQFKVGTGTRSILKMELLLA